MTQLQKSEVIMSHNSMLKAVHRKDDGRNLILYGFDAQNTYADQAAGDEVIAASATQSHMRWHPLRNEWVTYSAARQNRTFKPAANACPLCPSTDVDSPSEIPFEKFEIAVFDNKFPSMQPDSSDQPDVANLITKPAKGKCEVIIYASEHEGNLARLPIERLQLLVDVWADRYESLRGKNDITFVMPFENRGEEAGVTLHHPHGQLYAYSYSPPIIDQAVKSFRKANPIQDIIENHAETYGVFEDDYMIAFVPPFARYPFEIWVCPKRFSPGPWDFSEAERHSYASMIQKVVQLYDTYFGRISPYLYAMHAAPSGEDDHFHFSGQFYPLLRASDKLKYLGGCEQGSGSFLSDVLPEDAAKTLREVL